MKSFMASAFVLTGDRAGEALTDEADIAAMLEADDLAWLHLHAADPLCADWLAQHASYLDQQVLAALVAEETRPRAQIVEQGAMVILRGVNTNPRQDPEDMVSVRLWLDQKRIISLSLRTLASLGDVAEAIRSGQGRPATPGEFLCLLIDRLNMRIEEFLRRLDDETDDLEEQVLAEPDSALRRRVIATRRQVVTFRRHVAPQREALDQLGLTPPAFLSKREKRRLAEAEDRLKRAVEELDAMRERLTVVGDEIGNALSERLNRNLYLLSLVTALFLPLGFLTGLFGVNLAGIPGAGWPGAFWAFCGILAVVAALQVVLIRLLRFF